MCGIIGAWAIRGGDVQALEQRVSKGLDRLWHRGPDSSGMWKDGNGLTLGHRRLAIIDLSPTGHQPMESHNGRYVLTYNGEIYNFPELRQDLIDRGVQLRGHSDTEILLELFVHFGEKALPRIHGMFAFGIWDKKDKCLFLARDRIGKKPLYYTTRPDGEFLFASELNALASLVGLQNLEVDHKAIDGFLSDGLIAGTRSIYRGVFKLLPGHFARVDLSGTVKTKRYWSIDWHHKAKINKQEAEEETDRLLRQAVKVRLRSDVPVGVFLSGGIDSGLVTAYAAEATDQPITTISIGFNDTVFDERPLARMVSQKYGTRHVEYELDGSRPDDIVEILQKYGEPFADPSAIPSYFVSKAAATDLKVVLNGDGGDELFLGYRRHVAARMLATISARLPGVAPLGAKALVGGILPVPTSFRSKYAFIYRMLRALSQKGEERYRAIGADGFSALEKDRLFRPSAKTLFALERSSDKQPSFASLDELTATIARDFETALPDGLLIKMDIASMANSLEARSPFLDHRLAEFAHSLPGTVRLPGSETKPILRTLAVKYLPDEVVNAPKRGFEMPLFAWLSGDLKGLRDDLILARTGLMSEIFERSYLEKLLQGPAAFRIEPGRWAHLVWCLLALAVWDQKTRANPSEDV